MNKSKVSMKPIIKYLRELSVIVIGIVLTVGIGLWVNTNNNKKDQKDYILAVKMELEENAKQFDYCAKWLQKSANYADYLQSNKNSLNMDTLNYYAQTDGNGCGAWYTTSLSAFFPTNAFDMLKFSGAMRQIKSKELLSIWNAYSKIEIAKNNLDRYFQIKVEEFMKEVQLIAEEKTIDVPMQVFYSSGIPREMIRYCKQTSEP